jgi:hypothetical protein
VALEIPCQHVGGTRPAHGDNRNDACNKERSTLKGYQGRNAKPGNRRNEAEDLTTIAAAFILEDPRFLQSLPVRGLCIDLRAPNKTIFRRSGR